MQRVPTPDEALGIAVAREFLDMVSRQDWSRVDAILGPGYLPLYGMPNQQPGRDGWMRRQLSDPIFQEVADYHLAEISLAVNLPFVHLLVEERGTFPDGSVLRSPVALVLQIEAGHVVGAYGLSHAALIDHQRSSG